MLLIFWNENSFDGAASGWVKEISFHVMKIQIQPLDIKCFKVVY